VPHPYLAAITFERSGGGVAAVSRLLRDVFRQRWGSDCRLVTLLDDRDAETSLHASAMTRLRFGTRLAQAQVGGDCGWIFYSHLGLSRVQRFVPAPWRRPYGVFIHGIEAWRRLTPGQIDIVNGAALRVANSHVTASRVAEANPAIAPISVCQLALASGFQASGRGADGRRQPWTLGPHAVVLVARMMASERYKGHDELLDVWPAVRARVPDAQLVFVGGGDDVARLRSRAAALGIDHAVVFTGFIPDGELHDIYGRAAVFAMPSAGDGFGLVYLEAMAHGLPCIGSIHDAGREIIVDGVTGFLVDRADAPGLTDRVATLLCDEPRRRQMGQSGLRRWREQFTYERFASSMVNLIESTLDGVPAQRRAS
jgi:phosphatidylinositol alpha-1,6-mannosyltransferase